MRHETSRWVIHRRDFLKSSLAAAFLAGHAATASDSAPKLSFGIVTDSHYADIDTRGTRHYRESLAKMRECVDLMNDKQVDFVVELGDFKNGAETDNIEHLRAIESVYATFDGPRYHALGNHDMDSISKAAFKQNVENTGIPRERTYYSFDRNGVHFAVLDANFRSDGEDYDSGNFEWTDANVPEAQLEWLAGDLKQAAKPSIIFLHQLLDRDSGSHYVRNAKDVREVLNKNGNVIAVFQGHNHAGHYAQVEGIHYYTLKAMVEGSGEENNSYAIVEVLPEASLTVTGYRKASSTELKTHAEPRS